MENPKLTKREQEIIKLIAYEKKYIAKQLNISCTTVIAHINHIFDKLGVNSKTAAAIKAIRQGIVKIEDFIYDE